MSDTARARAEKLADERYRKGEYTSAHQLMERRAFIEGYMVRDAEAAMRAVGLRKQGE